MTAAKSSSSSHESGPAAFVAAQADIHEVAKDGKAQAGPKRYSFMELPDLLGEVRRVFAAHGLALIQEPVTVEGGVGMVTTILHESGWERATPMLVMRASGMPQDVGSVITYARRYQLAALVGLAGDDDADGVQRAPIQQDPQAQSRHDRNVYTEREPASATMPPHEGPAVRYPDDASTGPQRGTIASLSATLGVGKVKAGDFAHWVVNQRPGTNLPDGFLLTKGDASYVIAQLQERGAELAAAFKGQDVLPSQAGTDEPEEGA